MHKPSRASEVAAPHDSIGTETIDYNELTQQLKAIEEFGPNVTSPFEIRLFSCGRR